MKEKSVRVAGTWIENQIPDHPFYSKDAATWQLFWVVETLKIRD
jgi:hypothetical protein